jgi:hypothetical protein
VSAGRSKECDRWSTHVVARRRRCSSTPNSSPRRATEARSPTKSSPILSDYRSKHSTSLGRRSGTARRRSPSAEHRHQQSAEWIRAPELKNWTAGVLSSSPVKPREHREPMAQLCTNRRQIPGEPGEPEDPMAQLEVYPQSDAIVLRTGVFTLECVSEIRARNHRLRFTARCRLRRLGMTVSRSSDVALPVSRRDRSAKRVGAGRPARLGIIARPPPLDTRPHHGHFHGHFHSCAGRALFLY